MHPANPPSGPRRRAGLVRRIAAGAAILIALAGAGTMFARRTAPRPVETASLTRVVRADATAGAPNMALITTAAGTVRAPLGVAVHTTDLLLVQVYVTARPAVAAVECRIAIDGRLVDIERGSGDGGQAVCMWLARTNAHR